MTLWIKICGLSTADTVDAAVEAGADAVGFVFAPGSPRLVTPETARALVDRVPPSVQTVGVFRRQPVAEVVRLATEAGVALVQLHGDEPATDFDVVRAGGFGTIRAVAAEEWAAETPSERSLFQEDRLLLDAADPGAGKPFDATVLLDAADAPPLGWALAGGLEPTTVGGLVARFSPGGVDVSSGVESARGVKSVARIREFVAVARAAAAGAAAKSTAPPPPR